MFSTIGHLLVTLPQQQPNYSQNADFSEQKSAINPLKNFTKQPKYKHSNNNFKKIQPQININKRQSNTDNSELSWDTA